MFDGRIHVKMTWIESNNTRLLILYVILFILGVDEEWIDRMRNEGKY